MKDNNIRPYSLLHITSKESYVNILKTKCLIPSKHTNNKIQQLGDGIYFWDSNDELAVAQGKKIIYGRIKSNECIGIIAKVEIDMDKHMNLELENWFQSYAKYAKKISPQSYKKILDYIDIIQNQDEVSNRNLNKAGKLIGTTINLYLKYLLNNKQKEIDMVSGYFFHGKSNSNSFFKRANKTIRQFCIKNDKLVNNIFDDWNIIENI